MTTTKQYYFEKEDSDICYPEDYFTAYLDNESPEVEVYQAIPQKFSGIFWCKQEGFCGDGTQEYCGKQCKYYKPRNGKNGCCTHHTNRLYVSGEKVTLKKKT